MKRFFFANDAARREYSFLPKMVQDEFGKSLRQVQHGHPPTLPFKHLQGSIGPGVIELILNSGEAFRCIYIAKFTDRIVVLHSFSKKTNGVDRPAMRLASRRLKEVEDSMREMD